MTTENASSDARGTSAADVLEARLEPARMHRVKRVGLHIAALVLAALSGSASDDLTPGVDLVVVRRDTGAEVLRVRAGQLAEGDRLLAHTRRDLSTMTVEQFVREWRDIDA